MQFKKKIMQSSKFSFPYGVQLIISFKFFVRFNREKNKLGVFAYFPNFFFLGGEGGGGLFKYFMLKAKVSLTKNKNKETYN